MDLKKNNIQLGVAAIISDKNGRILIAKTPKLKNNWTIPGGHVDFGEKIDEALRREVFEETGLDVQVEKLINICETIISEKNFHIISFHFLCAPVDSCDLKLDERELTEGKWVSPEEAISEVLLDDFKKSIESFVELKNNL